MWNLIAGPIIETVNTVLKRVLPPEKMSEAERANVEKEVTLALTTQDFQQVMGQIQINLEEAKHESRFVSGWRPMVGWICAAGFGYHFVLQPVVMFGISAWTWWDGRPGDFPPLPAFDINTLLTVLLGMLGIGGMRTFEKWAGVNKSR